MHGHRGKTGLEVGNDFLEAVIGSGGRAEAFLIDIDEVLHACNCFRSGKIIPAAASCVDKAAPRLLAAGCASHAPAVHIRLAVAIGIHGALFDGCEQLIISGRNLNAGRLKDRRTIVYIKNLRVPRHQIHCILGAACLLHDVVKVLRDDILVLPCIHKRNQIRQQIIVYEHRSSCQLQRGNVNVRTAHGCVEQRVAVAAAVPRDLLAYNLNAIFVLSIELCDDVLHQSRIVGVVCPVHIIDRAGLDVRKCAGSEHCACSKSNNGASQFHVSHNYASSSLNDQLVKLSISSSQS